MRELGGKLGGENMSSKKADEGKKMGQEEGTAGGEKEPSSETQGRDSTGHGGGSNTFFV